MKNGLIVSNISNLYTVEDEETKDRFECSAKGKMRKEELTPMVGDRVIFEVLNAEKKKAIIHQILPRKNCIKRPRMANLSQVVLVISLKWPEPDLLLLDKQLVYAEYKHIHPIICVNKKDLNDDQMLEKIQQIYQKSGYTVIATNAKLKQGVAELKKLLKKNITAFTGNSGVGKSTLINALFCKVIAKEGDISLRIKRGKNTTTNSTLYKLAEGTYIADTPGFSTFDILELESRELDKYFIDVKEYANHCEFTHCSHIKEQNCGVKEAVSAGEIAEERYINYCKIYQLLKEKEEKRW